MMKMYKAAIIGAGKMGAFYSKPGDYSGILSHAHAYKKEKRVKLVAFVDINKKKAMKAAKIWKTKAYTNIDKAFNLEKPDIVSICTSDEVHKDNLAICLKYKPKLVFCEKPMTTDVESAEYFVKEYAKAGILLAVNYTRRWNRALINLKESIKQNKYGKCLNIIGIYNKGILHNGSHLIDLLRYFFGEVNQAVSLAARIDWKKPDPTVDAFLRFKNGAVAHIVAADARKYEVFELDLLFEKARIHLKKSGTKINYYKVIDNPKEKDYRMLKFCHTQDTKLRLTLLKVIPNLIKALEKKEKILCAGADALKTQKICLKLLENFK